MPVIAFAEQERIPADPLDDLARRITEEIFASTQADRRALHHARSAGELLREAKVRLRRDVGHGHWLQWLRQNCGLEESTAQRYMRIDRFWEFIQSKTDRDPDPLPIREANRLLAQAFGRSKRGGTSTKWDRLRSALRDHLQASLVAQRPVTVDDLIELVRNSLQPVPRRKADR